MKEKYRNIVIFSGGIDSTTVAWYLKNAGAEKDTLLVHVNQGFKKHEFACKYLAEQLNMKMEIVDLTDPLSKLKIEGMHYIPGYRVFNNLTAVAMADKYESAFVYSGEILYPYSDARYDSTEDVEDKHFNNWLGRKDGSNMVEVGFDSRYNFYKWYGKAEYNDPLMFAPIDIIYGLKKWQVIKLGNSLGAPLHKTLTCRNPIYKDSEEDFKHCGSCIFCLSRRASFIKSGVEDKTEYMELPPIPEELLGDK